MRRCVRSVASPSNLSPALFSLILRICAFAVWDHIKRSKFNFFWWDTTTFLSYQEETSYESSLLVHQSGSLALSSLHNVFLSLTSNAKSIYVLLAKYQLSNSSNVNFTGNFLYHVFPINRTTLKLILLILLIRDGI